MIYLVEWKDSDILKFICTGDGGQDFEEPTDWDTHYDTFFKDCADNINYPGLCKSIVCKDCACPHGFKQQSIWYRWFFDYVDPSSPEGQHAWSELVQGHLDREDTEILAEGEAGIPIWNDWLESRG